MQLQDDIPSWMPELDGAKTSCVVKIAGLAQVIPLSITYVKQSLFLHHIHKIVVSTPCLSWQLRSAADSHVIVLLCLEVQGCPHSSPTTSN